jgi:hypothetical protein
VPLGHKEQLLVFDSAAVNDSWVQTDQVEIYRKQFAQARQLAKNQKTWFLTHRPLWAYIRKAQPIISNKTLQLASDNRLGAKVSLVLSGHLHILEHLLFGNQRPTQIVVGNSGDKLDPPMLDHLAGLQIAGMKVKSGRAAAQFGYALITRNHHCNQITYYSERGRKLWSQSVH